jgi:hypothetical protein
MSGEINKSIPIKQSSVTPVFDFDEAPAPKIVGITKESSFPKQAAQKAVPPGFNKEEAQSAKTILPGSKVSKNQETLSAKDIKSAVGEIVSDLEKNNAWESAAKSKISFDFDDQEALTNYANKEWAMNAGAEIALNDHFEEKFASV